jgi:hypothetical protein
MVCARGRPPRLSLPDPARLLDPMESGVCLPFSTTDIPLRRGEEGRSMPWSSTEGGNSKLGVDEFERGRGFDGVEAGDGGSAEGGSFPSLTIHDN